MIFRIKYCALILALSLTSSACTHALIVPPTEQTRTPRNPANRANFLAHNPCPATNKPYGACPGYVVDHIKPLACGGADDSTNMQWQTTAEGKAKDLWERKGCQIKLK